MAGYLNPDFHCAKYVWTDSLGHTKSSQTNLVASLSLSFMEFGTMDRMPKCFGVLLWWFLTDYNRSYRGFQECFHDSCDCVAKILHHEWKKDNMRMQWIISVAFENNPYERTKRLEIRTLMTQTVHGLSWVLLSVLCWLIPWYCLILVRRKNIYKLLCF